jgi:hypothetical protein
MRFADACRNHALLLLEIAKEAPEFKDRATDLADMWLTIADLEDQLGGDRRSGANPTLN